jgi:outer membrane receptor protein involved in Fe transport
MLYDGFVNFVDLATVPSAAIERIEILNGGASPFSGEVDPRTVTIRDARSQSGLGLDVSGFQLVPPSKQSD